MPFVFPTKTESEDRTAQGMYLFKLNSLTPEQGKDPETGQPVPRLKWVFAVAQVINGGEKCDEFVGKEHWEWTSVSRGRKANMRLWTEALLKRDITDDEPLTDEDVVGKYAIATIGPVVNPRTGGTSIKLASLAPYYPNRNQQPVAEAAAATPQQTAASDDKELTDLPF